VRTGSKGIVARVLAIEMAGEGRDNNAVNNVINELADDPIVESDAEDGGRPRQRRRLNDN